MSISELISKLKEELEEHGDIPVLLLDDQWPEAINHLSMWPMSPVPSSTRAAWSFPKYARGIPPTDTLVLYN